MLRLSEAIRLGAMWKPQRFGGPLMPLAEESATCALAAAAEAYGDVELCSGVAWADRVPARTREIGVFVCPSCGSPRVNVNDEGFLMSIAHLNDTHRWSRERIADWVETFESEPETPDGQPANVPVRAWA